MIIDKNIETLTKAARATEAHLTKFENTAKESVELCKELMEYINAANLLQEIKAAQAKIITM